MFGKKKCGRCGKKVHSDFDFCPFCGMKIGNKENYGMLGKNDNLDFANELKLPMGMGAIFNQLVKSLDKQFKELDSEMKKNAGKMPEKKVKNGISISISTSGNNPPKIMINQYGDDNAKGAKPARSVPMKNLSKTALEKLPKLPKEEPTSEMKRLGDKIVYEIDIPGVKSLGDVSIISLENSIEIKAVAKNKVYSKLIPLNLPITRYNLVKNKLVLELDAK